MGAQPGVKEQPSPVEPDPWTRFSHLLVDAIAANAVYISAAERDAFRQRMEDVARQLKEPAPPPKVLIAAGSVVQALEHYSRQTQGAWNDTVSDLSNIVRTLMTHIESLHAGSSRVSQITRLIAEFDRVPLRELQPFHAGIESTLKTLADERAERQQEHEALLERLRSRVGDLEEAAHVRADSNSQATSAGRPSVDPCTGLPGRAEAEAAIHGAMSGTAQVFVAVFYVHRMSLTNARFGEKVGDQVILSCSQHIATGLAKGPAQLFRWMGPAFVAVLERSESVAAVASEVQRAASAPISRFFETSSRTVYLPMKMSGACIRTAGRTHAEVLDQIKRFILRASQVTD